ncbi:MAG: hypothetical protein M1812_002852 [Candelaria pacifica]|nr:MAG: hypothetical protein M1812_002852 [Candelaria pacifica]
MRPQPTPRASSSRENSHIPQNGIFLEDSLLDRILKKVESLQRKTQKTAGLLRAAQVQNSVTERELQGLLDTIIEGQQRVGTWPDSLDDSAQPERDSTESGPDLSEGVSAEIDTYPNPEEYAPTPRAGTSPGSFDGAVWLEHDTTESEPDLSEVVSANIGSHANPEDHAYTPRWGGSEDDSAYQSPSRTTSVGKRQREKGQSVSSVESKSSSVGQRRRKSKAPKNEATEVDGKKEQRDTSAEAQDVETISSSQRSRSVTFKADSALEDGLVGYLPTPEDDSPATTPQPAHGRSSSLGNLRDHPCLQILRDAIALIPQPAMPETPDEEVMISHPNLKQFLYKTKPVFSKSRVGKLEGRESIEFMKINPFLHVWAPRFGRHGALALVNNEDSIQKHEIYPVLMKDNDLGWKYGGDYRIGRSIIITADIWMSFPFEMRDPLLIIIANSAWGAAWLKKCGQNPNKGYTYLRNCLDVPNALSTDTGGDLRLAWVIIKFEDYSLGFYNKLARAWNPPRSSIIRRGTRQTGTSREASAEGPLLRRRADGVPDLSRRSEVLELLDTWDRNC